MSGMIGNLFGGKGNRAEASSQQPTYFDTLPTFAQDAWKQAVTGASGLANQPGAFAPADFTPAQQQGFDLASVGFAPMDANTFNSQLSIFRNPYTKDVVDATTRQIQDANRMLLGDINSDATDAGAFGSTRQGVAQGTQNAEALKTIADTTGTLNYQGFNDAAARATENFDRTNTLTQQQIANLLGIGEIQQQQNTAVKQAPMNALNFLLSAAQGVPVGGGGTSTSLGAQDDQGFLGRLSSIAANFGTAAKGFK